MELHTDKLTDRLMDLHLELHTHRQMEGQTITFHLSYVDINMHFSILLVTSYSYLPNRQGGSNKRGGWKFYQDLIKGEGKIFLINREGGYFLEN